MEIPCSTHGSRFKTVAPVRAAPTGWQVIIPGLSDNTFGREVKFPIELFEKQSWIYKK
jgi:hypothetical protein